MAIEVAVDFVWTFPDSSLYNAATVRPLVNAAIKAKLPIVGFSEAFAKSGAALAVYPDYRRMGIQTAELAPLFFAAKLYRRPTPSLCRCRWP